MTAIFADPLGWQPAPADVGTPAVASTSVEAEVDQRWQECRRGLLELRRLKNNWDGFGAPAANPEIVDSAIAYLSRLRERAEAVGPPQVVVLSPDGSVIMEWQSDSYRLEVEIAEPLRAEWMLTRRGTPPQHWDEDWSSSHDAYFKPGDATWEPEGEVAGDVAASVSAL